VELERTLRKLAIGDHAFIERMLACRHSNVAGSALDPKTHALVRLGALIAADAAPPSYLDAIESASEAGASEEELAGCLIAVLPALGTACVISAAPKLSLALGYDVAAALEESGSAFG
jgi:alkylhydroperoxidase/carboxymuconolactone decarboxylase family protein YurZ